MEHAFIDSTGDTIIIIVNEDTGDIYAHSSTKQIGHFNYEQKNCPDGYDTYTIFELWNTFIESEYQKRGIGTEMIRLGEVVFEYTNYPHDTGSHEGNHLSSEGLALINSCINKGIINHSLYGGLDSDFDDDD